MGKRILIIGNGFDIAHGLPTKYADFMEFAKYFLYIYSIENMKDALSKYKLSIPDSFPFKETLVSLFATRKALTTTNDDGTRTTTVSLSPEYLNNMAQNLTNNLWYEYFSRIIDKKLIIGNNWIDFEQEIAVVIKWLSDHVSSLDTAYTEVCNRLYQDINSDPRIAVLYEICIHIRAQEITILSDFIFRLYTDLNRITAALSVYLKYFVEALTPNRIELFENTSFDSVLSFNYTHTYEKLYSTDSTEICYIHGECGSSDPASCNMVIGIRNYDGTNNSSSVNTVSFDKFAQRVQKGTDKSYVPWIDRLKKESSDLAAFLSHFPAKEKNGIRYPEIYIYGHSLNEFDIDILKEFLIQNNTRLYLYPYGDKEDLFIRTKIIPIIGKERYENTSNTFPDTLIITNLNKGNP